MKESQLKVLENLATFKYLTPSQMIALGVVRCRQNLYPVLKAIRDTKRPYVQRSSMGVDPTYGRLEDMYCLTSHGAKYLIDNNIMESFDIRFPKGKPAVFHRDYKHRVATINIHLYLKLWLDSIGGYIDSASGYFDKPGSQRTGEPHVVNKIKLGDRPLGKEHYIIPDLVVKISTEKKESAFVFEQHNGKDTKKLLRQINEHIQALERGLISDSLEIDKAVRIGVVFEFSSILEATVRRLQALPDIQEYRNYFLFKTQESLEGSFAEWMLWDGTIVELD